jgi:hypothetical protein
MTANAGEQVLFDGQLGNKGLKLALNTTNVKAYINDQTYQFDFGINPVMGQWYGLVFNLNNQYSQLGAYAYKLNSASNKNPNMPITQTLIEVMNKKHSITPVGWVTDKQYALMPGQLKQTNIRLFKKTIGQSQQRNVLQQYVVRDNQLATIIDNAIPSIQLRRYNQSR